MGWEGEGKGLRGGEGEMETGVRRGGRRGDYSK